MTTIMIVAAFVIGYVFIAIESVTKVNKTAVALLMAVICWTIYNIGFGASLQSSIGFTKSLGETCEILFFLMGAMTIVEVVDRNGGFNFVREIIKADSKKALLWKITVITFFLSAVLDNLTTSIVMIMVLNKLIDGKSDKLKMASLVIIAANSGGAFSPIGDVTTIMLWVKGNISTLGIIRKLFLPAVASVAVPAFLISLTLKGAVTPATAVADNDTASDTSLSSGAKKIIFVIGVGGLLFVPVFRMLTDLPPFMGILLVLGILWVVTELIFHRKRYKKIDFNTLPDVSRLLHKIDLSTILFFLGILTAVAALEQTGILKSLGNFLDDTFNGNPYIVTGIIGILSSVVDNVPLVASCLGMYDVATPEALAAVGTSAAEAAAQLSLYGIDGTFWELLAYCAGVGGSMLIIGSAAGVVVMGLEKISFGWYLKNITLVAFVGYLSGILVYWLQSILLFS